MTRKIIRISKQFLKTKKEELEITYTNDRTRFERAGEEHVEEDLGQLTMSEGKRPQTEVWSSVWDGAEGKLNRVDHWIDTDRH